MADVRQRQRRKRNGKPEERKIAKRLCGADVGGKSPYFASERNFPSKDDHLNAKGMKKEICDGVSLESVSNDLKLTGAFYDLPAQELAKRLLGKILFRVLDTEEVLCGRIVETEAYLGEEDKACHTFAGKRTARTEPMYMAPGTAYVYVIYGMYHCLNVSSREPGACVLIRALEPIRGLHLMKNNRGARRRDNGAGLKDFQLCNGPSKLCQALYIEKANLNKEYMGLSSKFWLQEDRTDAAKQDKIVVTSSRIGIDSYGPEWASKPLRFYLMGNRCVSVRDKKAEGDVSN